MIKMILFLHPTFSRNKLTKAANIFYFEIFRYVLLNSEQALHSKHK